MTFANARMYEVCPSTADLWRRLLAGIAATAGIDMTVLEYAAPAPLAALWSRPDQGAVFMCGLPFSQTTPQPHLVAAPVPAPPDYADRPIYWSEFVVRAHSPWRTIEDTFDSRIAFTVPDSQSGCVAALSYFLEEHASARPTPLYQEIIAPTVTPLGALDAVVRGAADVAPIDSYAFSLLEQCRPDLTSGVRIVGRTAPTPIPPLVASVPIDPRLRAGFEDAHRHQPLRSLMQSLALRRFALPDPADYAVLADRCAVATRFWSARRLADRIHPAFVHPRP